MTILGVGLHHLGGVGVVSICFDGALGVFFGICVGDGYVANKFGWVIHGGARLRLPYVELCISVGVVQLRDSVYSCVVF